MNDELDPLLTIEQMMEWWQVSKDWIYDAVQQDRIPYTRIGGRKLRFRRSEMVAYLRSNDGGVDPGGAS